METYKFVLATLIIIAILIAVVVYTIKTKKIDYVKELALCLVNQAEEKFAEQGQKTGKTKFEWVAEKMRERLPSWLNSIFTEDDIAQFIEWAVTRMKRRLQTDEQ